MSNNNNIQEIVKNLSNLSITEVMELVSALEEKWGVSAQATVVSGDSEDKQEKEEKSSFDVVLKSFPAAAKMKLMLALKKPPINLSMDQLKEATANPDAANYKIQTEVDKESGEEIKKLLEPIGAVIVLE